MRKTTLFAFIGALALSTVLVGCQYDKNDPDPLPNNTNGGNGIVEPNNRGVGWNDNRATRNARTSTRRYDWDLDPTGLNTGRYAADPDGLVSTGQGNMARDLDRVGHDITQGTRNAVRGTADAVEDVGEGVVRGAKDVAHGAGTALEDVGNGIQRATH